MRLLSDGESYSMSLSWRKIRTTGSPRSRFKHAACFHGNCVYLFGGKDASKPLKDFWRFNLKSREWEELDIHGSTLGHLQGHTLVSYKHLILIFGGEFNNSINNAPLWIYNPDLNHIRKCLNDSDIIQPSGRRDHTAVVYNNKMYVYGGFDDIKGSSSELWEYSIAEEEWFLLLHLSEDKPGGRHGHSCVIHGNDMWVFGGMSGLIARSDLWKYNFVLQTWCQVRFSNGPQPISGHVSVVASDTMLIIGGERHGQIVNNIWSFDFDSVAWSKMEQDSRTSLPLLTQHSAIVVHGEIKCNDQNIRTTSVPQLQQKRIRSSAHYLADRPKSTPPNTSYHITSVNFNNKIYPSCQHEKSALSDFELQTVYYGNNSLCDIGQNKTIEKRPLLNDSFGNLSIGIDNYCVQNCLNKAEPLNIPHELNRSKHFYKKSDETNFCDFCSKCKINKSTPYVLSTRKKSLRSNCITCSRPLRRSTHECDITLEDLEQFTIKIERNEVQLQGSFTELNCNKQLGEKHAGEDVELKTFSTNSSFKVDCDVISSRTRCNAPNICVNGCGYPFNVTLKPNLVSMATQTESQDKRLSSNKIKYLYGPETECETRSEVDVKNSNLFILVFGGKSNCRKSFEVSPISVWKVDVPCP